MALRQDRSRARSKGVNSNCGIGRGTPSLSHLRSWCSLAVREPADDVSFIEDVDPEEITPARGNRHPPGEVFAPGGGCHCYPVLMRSTAFKITGAVVNSRTCSQHRVRFDTCTSQGVRALKRAFQHKRNGHFKIIIATHPVQR